MTWYFRWTADIFWENITSVWNYDWFVSKLDDSWNLVWVKKFWWSSYDVWYWLTSDISWNIYITWYFSWEIEIFWENMTSDWNYDLFISKLDSSWTSVWTKKVWWTGNDVWNSVAVDVLENIYVTWYFTETIDILWESLTSSWNNDIFILKLNSMWNLK